MKSCKTYKQFIESYIEGQLNQQDQVLLETHILQCDHCREEWEDAKSLSLIISESFCPTQSEQTAAETVMASISQSSTRNEFRFALFGKIAAGVLIVASVSVSFLAGRTSTQWNPSSLVKTSYAVKELEGTVLVKHANTDIWQPVALNSVIYTEDQFLSAPDGRITFAVDDQSTIELKENSTLILNINADETTLHLVHGMLDADLASPHGPFFVTTPHGQAEALGTEFTVKVD